MSNATSSSLAFSSLDALPTQLAILDEDSIILYTNRVQREFGAGHDYQDDSSSIDTSYPRACDLSADTGAATASEDIRAVIDDSRDEFSLEYPYETPEERLWFTIRATRFIDNGEAYVQVTHLDITDRKRAELEAEKKAGRLRNLARVLSRDLRNPLSVTVGYVGSLLDEAVASDRLERAVGALDRMDDIITDALVLARHDTVEGPSTVDLGARAAVAWEHIETDTTTLVIADSIEFQTGSNLLGYVFENLSQNSAEHGASDDGLTMTVGILDDDAAEAGFYIEDDGVDIPTETRGVVFEVSCSMGEEGTGLGLSIVAQAVRTHDWDVTITGAEDGGARFEITGTERPA